ncbi:MAG: biotin/lipoyl-binding protein [Alphaproteobacteria bacterium]|jgi:acetyl-CoA carboxylase biotin carboxyl carrier protein|nr:biotin/lipoyl-binding protein [Alphaproteobacteria bacterium]
MKDNDNIKDYSDFIKGLAKTLKDADLSEIEFNHDLQQSTVHIKVKREKEVLSQALNNPQMFMPHPFPHQHGPHMMPPAPVDMQVAKENIEGNEDLSKHPGAVLSPMVGIVYTRSGPETEDFVKVGSTVNEGDTILLIEAMKVFNPVKAPKSGKIAKILVKSNQPIEYGEVLLIIE